MEADKFERLVENAGGELAAKFDMLREKAECFVHKQVEEMKQRGEAVELGEDELRLLKAYRAFKARSQPGAVFSWSTPVDSAIVVPSEPCLIVDPREVLS